MSVKLLTEHHLEFLGLKGGYTGWSESTHVKIPDCWKSHDTAQLINNNMLPASSLKQLNNQNYEPLEVQV